MRFSTLGLALTVLLCMWTIEVSAQPAQTVQLPTFSFASVGTSVIVPDRGSAFLGGVNRDSEGRNEFGVPGIAFPGFQNRGIGQDRSASSFWVSVTIHDFDAMDQALLNSPSPDGFVRNYSGMPRGLPETPAAIPGRASSGKAAKLAGNWRVEPDSTPAVSDVAVEQANRAARQAIRAEAAQNYFASGQQAEADGKPNVARIYYQMAARRATGGLKQQVQARLDAIGGRTTVLAKNVP